MSQFLKDLWPKAKPYVVALAGIVVGAVLQRLGLADPAFNVVSATFGY